jgi:hypothetical protein
LYGTELGEKLPVFQLPALFLKSTSEMVLTCSFSDFLSKTFYTEAQCTLPETVSMPIFLTWLMGILPANRGFLLVGQVFLRNFENYTNR